jgi:predicted RNA-binding protein YlqC (UPF0109 family)
MERDQKFLEFVITSLVDHPEEVKINRTVDELGVLLTLSVNKDDMGKVIGRSGATAKAIRTILRVVGMKNDARVNLKIEEPEGGMRASQASNGADQDSDDRGTMADIPAREPKAAPQMRDLDDVLGDLKA